MLAAVRAGGYAVHLLKHFAEVILLVIAAELGDFLNRIVCVAQIAACLVIPQMVMVFLRAHAGKLAEQLAEIGCGDMMFPGQLLNPQRVRISVLHMFFDLLEGGKSPGFLQTPIRLPDLVKLVQQNLQLGLGYGGPSGYAW